ncbi:hypothetical protein [Bacillus cereus group sp. TH152-1LC]|uniref:hypothetical protein n=1 Tax=Bacillus cereus group sp. TH152-1LC TaxID=3018060 RepID=UPI0022E0E591|nr:hypothetical protein [Bacillus cereus group sp. TH152-1LC]MDA1675286.1 hypothetical protein [Bacillus cereus group sp. TH152-1LC]
MRSIKEIDEEIETTTEDIRVKKEKVKELDKKLLALLQEKSKTAEKLLEGKM